MKETYRFADLVWMPSWRKKEKKESMRQFCRTVIFIHVYTSLAISLCCSHWVRWPSFTRSMPSDDSASQCRGNKSETSAFTAFHHFLPCLKHVRIVLIFLSMNYGYRQSRNNHLVFTHFVMRGSSGIIRSISLVLWGIWFAAGYIQDPQKKKKYTL